jgi:hypothetical protein
MREMTRDEALPCQAQRPRTAIIATVRSNGAPHTAPLWIDLDGELLIFMCWRTSTTFGATRASRSAWTMRRCPTPL